MNAHMPDFQRPVAVVQHPTRGVAAAGPRAWIEYAVVGLLLGDLCIPMVQLGAYGIPVSLMALPVIFVWIAWASPLRGANAWWGPRLLAAMGLVVIWSSLWSYAVLQITPALADFTEIVKYLRFLPYLWLLCHLRPRRFEEVLLKGATLVAIWVVIVGILQATQWGGIGVWLAGLYAGEVHLAKLEMDGWRIVLTGQNANVGAAIAGFLFLIQYCLLLRQWRWWRACVAAGLATSILLTQSRTSIVGIGSVVILHGMFVAQISILKRIIFVGAAAILAYLIYVFFVAEHLEYVTIGFALLVEGADASANARLEQFDEAMRLFRLSPMFGAGPGKSTGRELVDPEYAWIAGHYGILGVVVFATYIVLHVRDGIKGSACLRPAGPVCAEAAVLCILFAIIIMTTNYVFSGMQLMAPLILLSMCNRLYLMGRRHMGARPPGTSG